MNRGLWIGVLMLLGGIGGWQPAVSGEEMAERAIAYSENPPVKVRAVSGSFANATLGRPVALLQPIHPSNRQSPRPFPAANMAVPLPAISQHHYRGVEPIASVAPPSGVIAASLPEMVSYPDLSEQDGFVPAQQEGVELFASDRPLTGLQRISSASPMLTLEPAHPESPPTGKWSKLGNWQATQPVTPPEPIAGAELGVVYEEPFPRYYFTAEYLLWWTKGDRAPIPLATTGNPVSPQDLANGIIPGTLGRTDTRILQNGDLHRGAFSGVRATLGWFLDDCGEKFVEIGGFWLPQRGLSDDYSSLNILGGVLTRPFILANNGQSTGEIIAHPGLSVGNLHISSPSQLWGLEANYLCKWCCGCDYRFDLFAGPRYLNLSEELTIVEDIQTLPRSELTPPDFPDNLLNRRFSVTDQFATRNQFYGGQVGVQGTWQRGRWSVDGRAKLGIGVNHQTLKIDGYFSPPLDVKPGGLFALASNIGTYDRDRFAFVPEFGISIGYNFTEAIRGSIGYNFLYISNVIRPGDQIDPVLDANLLPTVTTTLPRVNPPRPAVLFRETDYWAQGLTVGLEVRW